jgi:hypothetical protein
MYVCVCLVLLYQLCFRSNWLIINSHHLLLWEFGWTGRSYCWEFLVSLGRYAQSVPNWWRLPHPLQQKKCGYYKFIHKLRLILILQWNTRESWQNLGAYVCPSKCEPYLYFRFRQLTSVCTCHVFYWSRYSRHVVFYFFFFFLHVLNFIILVTVMPHFCTSIAILVVSLLHL